MTKRVSAKEARDNFSDLLGQVYYSKETVIVEKNGRPFAVLINPEAYERLQEQAKRELFQMIDEIQARNADKNPDEVYADVTAAVEEVRRERREGAQR